MALLTLAQAKSHLRITSSDYDADITLKLAQAEEIILNYLKSRAHKSAVIESSSVASPTVITTATAHGYTNGDTATITGHEDSVPAIFGPYVVSNVTEFTFTVPVAVTVAGTGGTSTVLWTGATAPGNVNSAVGLMLAHLYENRGDAAGGSIGGGQPDVNIWKAIELLLVRHRDPALV